ncbi:cobalamin-independent methionine synthase II family protein [Labedaea rhizosphaerae]|uniref:5-methyltetrahydropteroyltriglutamate--homocysteine methyltransferase n=1 Tax=Labedaea rhizosphaerae TaxID=598644 RepID=A0A4R6SFF5_LABRH|nr:cobalamin-independent methionine synthase II family protein [Labedaea rhizosphaerae]TDQ00304.1 5-methyltetrahydropteroyltriglutamate--homocysteine methyltransferase [Labedaea rhizosphaerae]
MRIPTESIGSIPRPEYLADAMREHGEGALSAAGLAEVQARAVAETIAALEQTGSTVLTDGEQAKPSFATYPIAGIETLSPDGVVIPFADGHTRQLPSLTEGPFRYRTRADEYLIAARKHTSRPIKQPTIAPSALSLLYPADGIDGYSRDQFLDDLVDEAAADIRRCLDAGADSVQLDFTEGRLSLKLDPSGDLLRSFVELNNRVLDRFTPDEQQRIGVHTCPGGDQDSVHSLDVDYAGLLPLLFEMHAGRFYVQMASETEPERALSVIADSLKPTQRVFVGVIDPIDPAVETPELVRDRILQAARILPVDRLGTCDDCGFAPFADDTSTSRETAFAKIKARVEGTRLAEAELG